MGLGLGLGLGLGQRVAVVTGAGTGVARILAVEIGEVFAGSVSRPVEET